MNYNEAVIKERTGKETKQFLSDLIVFIESHVTEDILNQDLNMLLTHQQFARVRKIIKAETLMFLRDEVQRM
ncbi:MAG: hypothetical protein RLZZ230_727 [Candidatus Parcubacteria bacterium]